MSSLVHANAHGVARRVLAAALGLLVSACSYELVRDARAPVARFAGGAGPRIAIVTLDNRSREPGLETLVTRTLRREGLRRGAYRLEEDPARADWVVRGRVEPVTTTAPTLSSFVLVLEQSVTVSLSLELEERDGTRHPLPSDLLRESEVFLASADLEVSRKNRREALRRVAALLSERVYDAIDAEVAR